MDRLAEKVGDDLTRRFKLYPVEEKCFLDLVNFASVPKTKLALLPVARDLPEGYQVLRVVHDPFMRNFIFQIVHPSFPLVDECSAQAHESEYLKWERRAVVAVDC
jgi:hypothetical protein